MDTLTDFALASPDEFALEHLISGAPPMCVPTPGIPNVGVPYTQLATNPLSGATTDSHSHTTNPMLGFPGLAGSGVITAGSDETVKQEIGEPSLSEMPNNSSVSGKQDLPEYHVDAVKTEPVDLPETVKSEPTEGTVEVKPEEQNLPPAEPERVIDVIINNIVCCFNTRCHLNLRLIAQEGLNVVYRRENGMVSLKLRTPPTTASIWSSGKITCTGSTSEDQAKQAARRVARILQKLGFQVRFTNFRVVNVLATCSLPYGIKIAAFSSDHKPQASYEPELHPGVTYQIKDPKATLKIFSTGSMTVLAPRVANVQSAVEHILPLTLNYKMKEAELDPAELQATQMYMSAAKRPLAHRKAQARRRAPTSVDNDELWDSDYGEDDLDSDASMD